MGVKFWQIGRQLQSGKWIIDKGESLGRKYLSGFDRRNLMEQIDERIRKPRSRVQWKEGDEVKVDVT